MKHLKQVSLAAIVCLLPALVSAQVVKDYTDAKGQPLPSGDTKIDLQSDGTTTTLRLQNLYAYGEAGMKPNENGERKAAYATDPNYFKGGTVYAMRNGENWCGSKSADSVVAAIRNKSKKCGAIIGQAKIGDNFLGMNFPSLKASGTDAQGKPIEWACQTTTFVLEKSDGKGVFLGHPGWATSNTDPSIGDYLVLAANQSRFPATALCYDTAGKILKLTPKMRAELATIIKVPSGSEGPKND